MRFVVFTVSTIVNRVQKINCYDFKTVSPYKWNRIYGLPFLHFANFSPFSSHNLLQAIVSIQRYSYRAFHIGFKSVASIEVTLALKAAFVCTTLKFCIMCDIFTYFMQIMYDIIICFVFGYS